MALPNDLPERFDPDAVDAFHHLGWDYDAGTGTAVLRYALDDVRFEERFVFPHAERLEVGPAFEHALTVLHVCAGTSYYKAAAPAVVTGVPAWAAGFVAELYLHGLAEYSWTNALDPVRPTVQTTGVTPRPDRWPGSAGPALVAVGGGKDSIVALESCRRAGREVTLASVGTHPAIEATVAVSGLDHLVVARRLDPALLALNERGARNGHIPVTAINSAALAALACGVGAAAVVMANESSASVPVTTHRGIPVNHQWSKSLACELALAELLPVRYFSLLRALHEVEIARRFAGLADYFGAVTSCNQAYTALGRAAGVRWCGTCPKCRFVFLALAPFLAPSQLVPVFEGADLLAEPAAVEGFRALAGLGGAPPMECVGTTHESRWALGRLAESPAWRHHAVVRALATEVNVVAGWDPLRERGPHAVPADWQEVADALA